MLVPDQHQKVAEAFAFICGGSFICAHWFTVAETLAHFGANVVTIITGSLAALFYAERLVKKIWAFAKYVWAKLWLTFG